MMEEFLRSAFDPIDSVTQGPAVAARVVLLVAAVVLVTGGPCPPGLASQQDWVLGGPCPPGLASQPLPPPPERAGSLRSRLASLVPVGVLFVASLSFRGLFVPFVLTAVTALAASFAPARRASRLAIAVAAIAILSAGTVVALAVAHGPSETASATREPAHGAAPSGGVNVAQATIGWLERGNLFRAQSTARQWASLEGDRPRDGTLVLSEIEWSLGHRDLGRRHAEDVARAAASPEAARKAAELLARFDREGGVAH